MIVPMIQYAFLVHHQDQTLFLQKLRETGVLHIKTGETPLTGTRDAAADEINRADKVTRELEMLAEAAETNETGRRPFAEIPSGRDILQSAIQWQNDKKHLELALENAESEWVYADQWGDFDRAIMSELREQGIDFVLYAVHERDFKSDWARQYRLEILNHRSPMVFFTIILCDGEENTLPLSPSPLPAKSKHELEAEKQRYRTEWADLNGRLLWVATEGISYLEAYREEVRQRLDMAEALQHSKTYLEGKLNLVEGFVPSGLEAKVEAMARDNDVVYWKQSVRPSDEPPVLLKNNRFSRLFESIGSLYSLPSYGEMDMTPFFAPFFMMFFGFCLGDAGYGLLLLVISLVARRKTNPSLQPAWVLAGWLSLATIFFGVLTGTFFGINLLEAKVSWLEPVKVLMIDSNQTFNAALLIGLFQILFGMALKAVNSVRQFGIVYGVAPLAWILLILGLIDHLVFKFWPGGSMYLAWLAVALILWFNDPGGGVFTRLGKGVWELYGITGFIGDLLSYIRLFALGISSAILGLVINDIALRMLEIKWVGWLLFILFLIFGHGANILIASLGAFVHPLRLTFVEFYKNAGFTGGGQAYKPFR
jgi:V/A-type H+-transporting ATPase subunit I